MPDERGRDDVLIGHEALAQQLFHRLWAGHVVQKEALCVRLRRAQPNAEKDKPGDTVRLFQRHARCHTRTHGVAHDDHLVELSFVEDLPGLPRPQPRAVRQFNRLGAVAEADEVGRENAMAAERRNHAVEVGVSGRAGGCAV